MSIRNFIFSIKKLICLLTSTIIIDGLNGGFWKFREKIPLGKINRLIYDSYCEKFGCFIGLGAKFEGPPILPHGLNGIHISNKAIIGHDVVIFHQVTIGSNSMINHKYYGAPTIGNHVYIGAGAKIIGKVNIGDNCRIGANCVVVKDMPSNTTAVMPPTRFINHAGKLMNEFEPFKA